MSMQPSAFSSSVNTPTTDNLTPRRKGRSRFILLLLLCGIVFGIYWYNEHRKISWEETLSPMYWWRRVRGEDLIQPQNAMLLHGNRELPEVAITFDDGPHGESRARILDILKTHHVKATFFDVGEHMNQYPELVHRTLTEGHEIGNHSQNHQRVDGLSEQARHREINDAAISYYRITGQHLRLFRPPGMRYNAAAVEEIKRLGYLLIGYTTASRDFDPVETPEFIAQRTVRRTEAGSILLLHDYPATVEALPAILSQLQAQGYRFVTISEMIAHLPEKSCNALSLNTASD